MKFSAYIFLLVAFFSCDRSDINLDAPACIKKQVEKIEKEDARNPPAEVWEWQVGDSKYYYVTSACCDQFSSLYDTNCNLVCAPDGGITGRGDGKCPQFEGDVKKTLIWKDDRR